MHQESRLLRLSVRGLLFALAIFPTVLTAQPKFDYSQPFLATSQIGFLPNSVKEVTLFAGQQETSLPDKMTFYITKVGYRIPRVTDAPDEWGNPVFRWPFEIDEGEYIEEGSIRVGDGTCLYIGTLEKMETSWGTLWRGDFSDFEQIGAFQIETRWAFTAPFEVSEIIYDRLQRNYLEFTYAQRSGVEIPGVRPVENADDGRLYEDTSYYLPVAGGWNDAGDWRKWLFLTLPNLDALGQIAEYGHPAFRQQALAEMKWGNDYFQNMITDEGRVYEDTGAGRNRAGDYDETWWNENHPGVTAAGDLESDNVPLTGKGRHVRSNYNPLVQFQFIRHQAKASTLMSPVEKNNALVLADRAWRYSRSRSHDGRTLFVAEELLAAIELLEAGSPNVSPATLQDLATLLLARQETREGTLSGYFMEKDETDGYRSIAFPAEPTMALLRLVEIDHPDLQDVTAQASLAVQLYIDDYLVADAKTNAFGIPPYGIYVNPPFPKAQRFRPAGNNRFVRTFIHVFSDDPIPHGVNAGFLQQAYVMARAGSHFERKDWQDHAQRILNWTSGHNTNGLCLFTDLGFKHPIPASFMNYRIPSAVLIGYFGRPDDTPYIETSNAVEWSTQEIWDVPFYYTIGLISYLTAKQ